MRKAHWGAALALVAFLLPAHAAEAATPESKVTAPRPEIGSLSNSSDPKDHHCSGSVVASPRGNVIVTAAHCVYGKRNVFFSPGYHDGQAPYGTWQSAAIYVDDGWKTSNDINGAGSPYDYAFVVLQPRNGKNVAEVTGSSLKLRIDAPLPADMTVFGYPSAKDKPYLCDSTASRDGQHWETLQCLGIPGGFSGGPWVLRGTKDLIGVIGGKGQNLPPTDPRNYSVRFDNRVKALYDKAVSAPVPPGNGNLGYPLGSGSTWKHAQLITSGRFTGSTQLDMIVRWSDGEVTLYQGGSTTDPQKPFAGETRLAAPKSIWTHARTVSGGNWTGGGTPDLLVRWSDGEFTIYGDVATAGLGREHRVQAPNDLWTHATVTAGRGNDIIVRWSDGEVSLYPDVDGRLHREIQLVAP